MAAAVVAAAAASVGKTATARIMTMLPGTSCSGGVIYCPPASVALLSRSPDFSSCEPAFPTGDRCCFSSSSWRRSLNSLIPSFICSSSPRSLYFISSSIFRSCSKENGFTAASCWAGTCPSEAAPFVARDKLSFPRPRALVYCYFSVASKGSLGVKTQRTSISLTSLGRERDSKEKK